MFQLVSRRPSLGSRIEKGGLLSIICFIFHYRQNKKAPKPCVTKILKAFNITLCRAIRLTRVVISTLINPSIIKVL